MSWPWTESRTLYKGDPGSAQTFRPPAVAVHAGEIWVMWTGRSNEVWYAHGLSMDTLTPRIPFIPDKDKFPSVTTTRNITMIDCNGVLHVVINEDNGYYDDNTNRPSFTHYRYDDVTELWKDRDSLAILTESDPAFGCFRGELFCAFRATNGHQVRFARWREHVGWTPQSGNTAWKSHSVPTMYSMDDNLYLITTGNDDGRGLWQMKYDSGTNSFIGDPDHQFPNGESTGYSVFSASDSNWAAASFQDHNGKAIYVCIRMNDRRNTNDNKKWDPHENIGYSSRDTPNVVITGGKIYCIYNADDDTGFIRWTSRPLNVFGFSDWMSSLSGDLPLSALSLPGTHDSAAYHINNKLVALSAQTQVMSIKSQLESGIRFLDLRVGVIWDLLFVIPPVPNPPIHMYHGADDLGITFKSVLLDIYTWLNEHQTEALVISVKADGIANSGYNMPHLIFDILDENENKHLWIFDDKTPTLKEARGKIQLLRRFEMPQPARKAGINLYDGWIDNSNLPFKITDNTGLCFNIEDWYQFYGLDLYDVVNNKIGAVINILNAAGTHDWTKDPNTWYITFCSCLGSPAHRDGKFTMHEIIPKVAALGDYELFKGHITGVNSRLFNYLSEVYSKGSQPKVRLGIIPMDFTGVHHGITELIVGYNFL